MSQPDFDYSKLHYYVDALFVLTFGAIGTTSGAVTNGLFGNSCDEWEQVFIPLLCITMYKYYLLT